MPSGSPSIKHCDVWAMCSSMWSRSRASQEHQTCCKHAADLHGFFLCLLLVAFVPPARSHLRLADAVPVPRNPGSPDRLEAALRAMGAPRPPGLVEATTELYPGTHPVTAWASWGRMGAHPDIPSMAAEPKARCSECPSLRGRSFKALLLYPKMKEPPLTHHTLPSN